MEFLCPGFRSPRTECAALALAPPEMPARLQMSTGLPFGVVVRTRETQRLGADSARAIKNLARFAGRQ